ncbi:MAG: hypothetical protein K6G18_09795 [Treponema sp.]|nr:hypothetical protein [Treponema sp.]
MRQQFFSYYMWFIATLLIAMTVLILLNIRESKRKDKIIANSEMFLRHSMLVQESERKRISLDLHDSVLQGMRCVSRLAENLSDKKAAREIIDTQTENIESIRKLCYNLTPPAINKGNLIPSLTFLGQKIFDTANSGFQFRVVCEQGVDFDRWEEDALLNLYRIVQEVLQNIQKHAEAEEATVFFKDCGPDSLKIIITDDGRGMDPELVARINDSSFEQLEGLHFGLRNIFERAKLLGGKVTYFSEDGCGTRLTVEF